MGCPLPPECVLPEDYVLDLTYEGVRCRQCGAALGVGWRRLGRRLVGLVVGRARVRELVKVCPACRQVHRSELLDGAVPSGGIYCLDLIVAVGLARYRDGRQNGEIRRDLRKRHGLEVPISTIGDLAHRFLDYAGALHYRSAPAIRAYLQGRGGYVLHIDGTCEAGTQTLFVALTGGCRLVLCSGKMRTENLAETSAVLSRCEDLYGPPLAVVSDLSEKIAEAIKALWPQVPHLLCHFHFLGAVGEKLLRSLHGELSALLRGAKVRSRLRGMRTDLVRYSKGGTPVSPEQMERFLEDPCGAPQVDAGQRRRCVCHMLLRWVSDYQSELSGKYFPFDLPALTLYRRCRDLGDLLDEELALEGLCREEVKTIGTMAAHLKPVTGEGEISRSAERLRKVRELFDELREVLRPENPREAGSVQTAQLPAAERLEGDLEAYRERLQKRASREQDPGRKKAAGIILGYLDKYWDKLFGHVLWVEGRQEPIVVARTNQISEGLFGDHKRKLRREVGTKKLARLVETGRADAILVANLQQQAYVDLIYGGSLENMPQRLACCDREAKDILRRRKTERTDTPFGINKKFLRAPGFLQRTRRAVRQMIQEIAAERGAAG